MGLSLRGRSLYSKCGLEQTESLGAHRQGRVHRWEGDLGERAGARSPTLREPAWLGGGGAGTPCGADFGERPKGLGNGLYQHQSGGQVCREG